MSIRNISALVLILASLLCLYPGLTSPMMTITIKAVLPLLGEMQFYEATQSILQTIKSLFEADNNLVAWLILLFSIVVPVAKALMLLTVLFFHQLGVRHHLFKIVSLIGKWSMADVFVVSIFMAFLSNQSNTYVDAILHAGFYYFTAYCVLSILGTQLIDLDYINPEKVESLY